MTEIPIQENREDRYGKTERKNLTLTAEAVEAVQAYADRHGLYFSVAIESLALMGLGQATADALPRLVANLLERAFNRQFNRFAKLLSYAALSAEEASAKTDFLILQLFRREAQRDPDNFIAVMVAAISRAIANQGALGMYAYLQAKKRGKWRGQTAVTAAQPRAGDNHQATQWCRNLATAP